MSKRWSRTRIFLVVLAGALLGCCVFGSVAALVLGPDALKEVKASQVHRRLVTLYLAVEHHCDEHGSYPSDAGPLPATHGSTSQVVDFGTDPVFREIHWVFTPPEAVYFSYSIRQLPDGGVEVLAEGDLDEDGISSIRRVTCGEGCRCGRIEIENELE